MGSDIERLVGAAKEGDKNALEELISKIQDKIYGRPYACFITLSMLKTPPRKSC